MVNITRLKDERYIGYQIAEITSVPYYELYDKDLDRANYMNQVFFTQLITSLYRRADLDNTAFEFIWVSVGVANQTYKAQVKIFVIIREIGTNSIELSNKINDVSQSLKNDFENKNFTLRFLDTESDLSEFINITEEVDASKVLAVSKKERAVSNVTLLNGCIYYTDLAEPSENLNLSVLSNFMTQYPNSAISMQLIPTSYTKQELYAIEECKNFLNVYSGNVRYQHGIRIDNNTQRIIDAYNYYSNASKEPLFYFNFIIYSQASSAFVLANKLMDSLEVEGKTTGSSFEIVDITDCGLKPSGNLSVSPWVSSDILVFKKREMTFWGLKNAPNHFIRLKYLMTANEVKAVFKIPIDDGKAIGLNSKKVLTNRERLHQSVISDNNFKLGIIQNTSISDNNANVHAGIALNDFTKHGLIVGMPGSGKTNFSLGLLLQFWNEFHIPFLAIEPTKNEYRSLIDSISELQIFTPGKNNISPYIINPFIPPKGVTIESFIPSLMTAFKAAFSMPNPLPDIFLGAINDCYNEYGWKSDSTIEDPHIERFGLYEFIKVFKRKIQNMDYKGEVKANMESAGVVRLISLIEQNSNIYDTINTIPLEDLLSKPTVIELNAINNKEQKSLIMALLLIFICVYTKNNISGDGKLKNVMLIDEAHVLLSGNNVKSEDSADSQGSTIEALEDMIAEIRSYGTSIIIADQSPTKVGRNIIANTNVKIIFKLVEKENKDAISTATNMNASDYDVLGRLGVGEAMLHYGRIYSPLLIKTYNVCDRAVIRPVILDDEITDKTRYWNDKMKLLIPYSECRSNCMCSDKCEFKTRTNADYLASRLINLYLNKINEKNVLIRFLVTMDGEISRVLQENQDINTNLRLINCIKIKFLRKALLIKSFDITKSEYQFILNHKNFLKKNQEGIDRIG